MTSFSQPNSIGVVAAIARIGTGIIVIKFKTIISLKVGVASL
jgi:hypothetical protein